MRTETIKLRCPFSYLKCVLILFDRFVSNIDNRPLWPNANRLKPIIEPQGECVYGDVGHDKGDIGRGSVWIIYASFLELHSETALIGWTYSPRSYARLHTSVFKFVQIYLFRRYSINPWQIPLFVAVTTSRRKMSKASITKTVSRCVNLKFVGDNLILLCGNTAARPRATRAQQCRNSGLGESSPRAANRNGNPGMTPAQCDHDQTFVAEFLALVQHRFTRWKQPKRFWNSSNVLLSIITLFGSLPFCNTFALKYTY